MAASPLTETDAVIIGAGPVGLYQVFQLGLQGVKAHVIDALPQAGGQCLALYPDKPIYDIPGIVRCTGQELTQRLLEQIAPFSAQFHFQQQVQTVQQQSDGRFVVQTDTGTTLLSKTVFIAAGVGAFVPRPLALDGIAAFTGRQLHYHALDTKVFDQREVVVIGDGEEALQTVLRLCAQHPDQHPHKARRITLLYRRDALSASEATQQQFRALQAAGHVQFVVGQASGFQEANGVMQALHITDPQGATHTLPLDHLLVLQGLSPKLGPISNWGMELDRKQLRVNPENCATSVPGIFAVGDINTYPGKKKLIVCGFHECVQAAFAAMAVIQPGTPVFLQYTTTSPALHKLLQVKTPTN